MAITAAQQADALFKASLGVANPKPSGQFFEQPVKASPFILPSYIWKDENLIPLTAPVLSDQEIFGVVKKFVDLQLILVSGSTQSYTSPDLHDVIPFNFGDGTSYNYTIKDSTGTAIPFGTNDWVLQNNVLTFYGGITGLSLPPKITFYQYIGSFGLGSNGSSTNTYYHNQGIASTLWTIVHNLNKYPAVVVTDSSVTKTQVYGDITFIDLNTVTIGFAGSMTGEAYLT